MKILIYVNKDKDEKNVWTNDFIKILEGEKIEYDFYDENMLGKGYDGIFVYGGDGTVLALTEFACKNGLPIVSINAGKLGFLTEFEKDETLTAVKLFKENKLIKDVRVTEKMVYDGKEYIALNDIVVHRTYNGGGNGLVVNLSAYIDDKPVYDIKGDGVIISTPTGSTAYSLSSGGAILAPGISAFSMTPISAHSLNLRPVVYSSENRCKIKLSDGFNAGVFVDGKYIGTLKNKESITVEKYGKGVVFLRRNDSDFFTRISRKFV